MNNLAFISVTITFVVFVVSGLDRTARLAQVEQSTWNKVHHFAGVPIVTSDSMLAAE